MIAFQGIEILTIQNKFRKHLESRFEIKWLVANYWIRKFRIIAEYFHSGIDCKNNDMIPSLYLDNSVIGPQIFELGWISEQSVSHLKSTFLVKHCAYKSFQFEIVYNAFYLSI